MIFMTSLKINLDYVSEKHLSSTKILCLMLGITFLAYATFVIFSNEEEISKLEHEIDKFKMQSHKLVSRQPVENLDITATQIKQADLVLKELGQPWPVLLSELENKTPKNISLLSVKPDKTKLRLLLTGEAENMQDVLDYLRLLATSNIFKDVVIDKHEYVESDQVEVVRFTISGLWKN